jgi:tetratricopeptide (TPR) repeat protein
MYHYNVEERIERSQQVRLSLDEAAKAYRRALEIAPRSAEARLRLGRVLALLGRPDEAKTAFERVIAEGAHEETRWLAHMFLGRVHEQTGRHVEAVTSYRRALGLRATQSAIIALANALDRSGERVAAVAQLQLLGTTEDHSTLCEDGCDPWLNYNLVDRKRVGASLGALVHQACEVPR